MKSKNYSGFTLVELLVVIAVVAMLMTVLFPNFMAARERARDAQRKSDLSQIQKSLELYKLDQNPPAFPTTDSSTGTFASGLCGTCWSSGANCTGNIYMRKFSCDPAGTTPSPYIYKSSTTDTLKYTLSTCLENDADTDRDITPEPTCSFTGVSYTINEP